MTRLQRRSATRFIITMPTLCHRILKRLVLAAAVGAASAANSLPGDATARFVMSAQGLDIAQVDWRMKRGSNGEHTYESVSQSIGVARLIRNEKVTERSRWRLADGAVQPLEYSYSRRGGKRVRDASLRFDWKNANALATLNGNSRQVTIVSGVQDKLSYLLSLMNRLERGRALGSIVVNDGGKSKRYSFRQVANESLDTELGRLDAVQVERRVDGDDRVTWVWMAPKLGYFPVRIEHREDGETVKLLLQSLQGVTAR